MRAVLLSLLLAAPALLAPGARAQVQPTAPGLAGAELPQLLDRDIFFGDPEISGAQLSPEGTYLTFQKPLDGVMNVWIKGVDEPFEDARPLTADDRPVPGSFWSRDERYVLYVQDRGGDENYHVWAVDPDAPNGPDGVPPARDLTPAEGARAIILDVPESDAGHILVGLNDRDPAWHDVYRVDLQTGEREQLIENTERIAGWVTDLDGDVRLALRTTPAGSTEILSVRDGELGETVYTCTVMETCGPDRFHPDGRRVYMQTNKGDRDLVELVLFDPETGEETLVERDPEGQVDFGAAVFSDLTDELVATVYNGDRQRIYTKDPAWTADLAFLNEQLPGGEVTPSGSTDDERLWLVTRYSDTDPGSRYLFDRDTRELTLLYASRPELPQEAMAPMQPVRYTARDGREIPAYLTLPKGTDGTNLPTLLLVHGGPWARSSWGYNSYAQFLANRGYAVLDPNFRGSTGYGKDHLNAGNGEWGTGTMQHDLSDGVAWLVEQGIADPERVGIMGGSYGGYATLAGLAFTPDLYAAGVDIVGPSSIPTLLASIPPYWESARTIFNTRIGDPENAQDLARMEAQSPLNSADAISAPLLIIQGANDPRVKQAESDQIVIALRERGYPIQYIVAPDEGHGFRGETNQLAQNAATEAFLAEHLGGRAQTTMADDVRTRLDELTIDPASVTLAAAPEGAAAGTFDASQIEPATYTYGIEMSVMGQELAFDVVRTLAVEGDAYVLTDAATTPMGAMSDVTRLAADDFRPLSRRVSQGPVRIAFDYGTDRVTGQIEAPGQTIPVDAALDAPLAIEGASLEVGVGTLPLAEGYRAQFAGFDSQTTVPVMTTIEVTGRESVTVPAGTFDAWVVRLTKGDGTTGQDGTLWVADGVVVKSEAGLGPQMGGGTVVSELKATD